MRIRHIAGLALAATAVAAVATPARAALIVDDFEVYTDGLAIATSASSTTMPWVRFGNAVSNLIAEDANVIGGSLSGQVALSWASGANATVRKNYAAAGQDFTGYASATVRVDSRFLNAAALPDGRALVKLSFESNLTGSDNARATYGTTNAAAVLLDGDESTAQALTFNINPTDVVYTGAAGVRPTLAQALADVRSIGLRFERTSTVGGSETIVIDDFTLVPVPEPAAAGTLLFAGVALLARRRTRKEVG